MPQAVSLTDRIKYISDTDDDGVVGVMVLMGPTEQDTIVREVKSKTDFKRVYKSFRNKEVLEQMTK
jgi:hypothetical protein